MGRVWYTQYAVKTRTFNRMWHTGWSKLPSLGQQGGNQNRDLQMGSHLCEYWAEMYTLLILNGLRKSNLHPRPWWNSTLNKVLQPHGGYIDGSWHVFQLDWETAKIGMMSHENRTMNSHSMVRRFLLIFDAWETHFFQRFSIHLRSVPNLTKMKHQMMRFCTNLNDITAPCFMYLLLARQCYYILFPTKFVIWSGGSASCLQIIWMFSTCIRKWATMSAQKCSSGCKNCQIPIYW
jgi:hypothetical protein